MGGAKPGGGRILAVAAIAAALTAGASLAAVSWADQPGASPSAAGKGAPASPSPTTSATGSAATLANCPSLAMLDPAYTQLSEAELERRLDAAAPFPPSMRVSQKPAIDGSLRAYRPEQRACMKRTMQIHMLVSYENLVGPGGALWYHGLTAEALERHWLTIPLDRPPNQPRSLADRQAAVAFVDSLVQNITSSQPEDAPYYRRLYLGGLLACHAKESALHLIGGQRQTGCIDLDGALRAQRLTTPSSKPPVHPPSPSRGSSGVLDPWNSGRPNAPTRPRAPRPTPELKDPWQSGKDPLQRRK